MGWKKRERAAVFIEGFNAWKTRKKKGEKLPPRTQSLAYPPRRGRAGPRVGRRRQRRWDVPRGGARRLLYSWKGRKGGVGVLVRARKRQRKSRSGRVGSGRRVRTEEVSRFRADFVFGGRAAAVPGWVHRLGWVGVRWGTDGRRRGLVVGSGSCARTAPRGRYRLTT